MDKRSLPFLMPNIGSEEEEAIAVLSFVADDLLEDFHRSVARLRLQAERYSNGAVLFALFSFTLFLAQDFERAPLPLLGLLGLLPIASLVAAALLRTRLVEPSRFTPPQILQARKLAWQWLAVPLDPETMILWDTLTDEALPLAIPVSPPRRQGWLLQEAWGPIHLLEEEKALVRQMAEALEQWEAAPTPVRLPRIGQHQEALLAILKTLPRGRHVTPAPLLAPARPLEAGQEDLHHLMALYRSHRITQRQLDAWQEAVPRFKSALERALRTALPTMDPPPAPPSTHPSSDVETLIAKLEIVHSSTVEVLQETLHEELAKQQRDLDAQLKVLEQEWEQGRNNAHSTNDILINSLRRQIDDMTQRALPEAEQALKESQSKLGEANGRVSKCESDLADKRKQLLLAGSGSSDTPRASDERKRQLSGEIERLSSMLPEIQRSARTLEEVVEFQRGSLIRVQRQLDSLQQEHENYSQHRDQEFQRLDTAFEARQGSLRDRFAPTMKAIEADLVYFSKLVDRYRAALEPFRVNLILEEEASRPYTQVLNHSDQLLSDKQRALTLWATTVQSYVQQRRDGIERIVKEMDAAALPNIGLTQPRLMLLPIWYIEARAGHASFSPRQRQKPAEQVRLLAPFGAALTGRRQALPDGNPEMLAPVPALQERLDALMRSERRAALQAAARQEGRAARFDERALQKISVPTQMPQAMVGLLRAVLQSPPGAPTIPSLTGGAPALPAPSPNGVPSDEFVLSADPSDDPDAWSEALPDERIPAPNTDEWEEPADDASS